MLTVADGGRGSGPCCSQQRYLKFGQNFYDSNLFYQQ